MSSREEIETVLDSLKKLIMEMKERIDEIDERTKQFKKFPQTSHPDD